MFNFKVLVQILLFVQFKQTLTKFTCGEKFVSTGLIVGGTYSVRGQWPWMSALYRKNGLKYICGGSLVSASHVVTAAHCLQEKASSTPMSSEQLLVLLGKFDLSNSNEPGSIAKDVDRIIVHPDWKYDEVKYDADIAILFLSGDVEFSEYIAPVCLPTARVNVPIDGGTIVGWGQSETAKLHENLPKHETVKAVTNEFCFLNNYILAKISSNRTFCAGGKNVSPCRGDSGGGFFEKKGKLWILQGIISSAITNDNECDSNNLAVYTNINSFTLWIKNAIEGWELQSIQYISLDNSFIFETYDGVNRYTSKVNSLSNTNENVEIKNARGDHIGSNTNVDVKTFKMTGELASTHLPNGIGEIFPNLEILQVEYCRFKFIRKINFKNMNKLIVLSLQANEITDFPHDTLWDLKKLRKVDFSRNNLIYLDPKLFQNMLNLEVFHAHFNSLQYLDGRLFNRNLNLKVLTFDFNKITVVGVEFEKLKLLREVNLRDNVCINLKFPDNSLEKLTTAIKNNCNEALELN